MSQKKVDYYKQAKANRKREGDHGKPFSEGRIDC